MAVKSDNLWALYVIFFFPWAFYLRQSSLYKLPFKRFSSPSAQTNLFINNSLMVYDNYLLLWMKKSLKKESENIVIAQNITTQEFTHSSHFEKYHSSAVVQWPWTVQGVLSHMAGLTCIPSEHISPVLLSLFPHQLPVALLSKNLLPQGCKQHETSECNICLTS